MVKIPGENRLFTRNIQSQINEVNQIHKIKPKNITLLIYFYNIATIEVFTTEEGFQLFTINYSKALKG